MQTVSLDFSKIIGRIKPSSAGCPKGFTARRQGERVAA